MDLDVSVIIPCKNEKETIAEVIIAVDRELQQGGFQYEVIVVDNGSIDGSDAIAKKLNAKIIYSLAGTVAEVRNMGVDVARGKVLVFLDADVVVQLLWGKTLRTIYENMMNNDKFITGSHPSVPYNIKPLLASWYQGISKDIRNTHVGTGHMVVSLNAFRRIGGFNNNLVSGEDYDFCLRGKKLGVVVVSNQQLVACHHGYPESLAGFARREIWHGEGDCVNLKSVLGSRVAICGGFFVLLNILMVASLFFYVYISVFFLLTLILMVFLVNKYKFGYSNMREFLYRSVVAYVYLFSRGLSMPISIFKKYRNIFT